MSADFGDFEVRLFDPRGKPLRDIRTSPTYSFTLNDVGDCTFTLATNDDAFSEGNIEFGTAVVINHEFLPSWVGFIDPASSKTWNYGSVDLTCLSAEKFFDWRFALPRKLNGTPGVIYTALMEQINEAADGGIKIYPGDVMKEGFNMFYPLMGRANDVVRFITRKHGAEFSVTPDYNTGGNLILRGNLYQHKGLDTQVTFSHKNMELNGAVIVEDAVDGEIWNHVTYYSSPQSGGAGLIVGAAQRDEESISRFGLRMYLGEVASDSEESLNFLAKTWLMGHAFPKKTITPSLLNVGNLYKTLDTGNWYNWESHVAGFTNGQLGAVDYTRLTGFEVNTSEKKVNALVESWSNKYDLRSIWVNLIYG